MPLIPGETAKLVFDLLPTSYLFRAGHAVRVAIAGADRDHFAPVPSQGASVRIHWGGGSASNISLPVVHQPATRAAPSRMSDSVTSSEARPNSSSASTGM